MCLFAGPVSLVNCKCGSNHVHFCVTMQKNILSNCHSVQQILYMIGKQLILKVFFVAARFQLSITKNCLGSLDGMLVNIVLDNPKGDTQVVLNVSQGKFKFLARSKLKWSKKTQKFSQLSVQILFCIYHQYLIVLKHV